MFPIPSPAFSVRYNSMRKPVSSSTDWSHLQYDPLIGKFGGYKTGRRSSESQNVSLPSSLSLIEKPCKKQVLDPTDGGGWYRSAVVEAFVMMCGVSSI
jgi:hypothetical protein